MKKSKDPTDYREQWSKDELKKIQQRREQGKAPNPDYNRKLMILLAVIIVLGVISMILGV